MKSQLEQFIRSAKDKQELSWEEKKIVEDLGENLTAQVDSLNRAVASLQEAVEHMKEQGVLSQELLDKMNNLRDAIREIVEQYGDSLLFMPPEQGEKISWNDMKGAVEKMKDILPDLQQHLDNALRYLEALRRDQELVGLAQRARDLAGRQLDMMSGGGPDSVARQQELMGDIDNLAEELDGMAGGDSSARFDRRDISSLDEIDSLRRAIDSLLSENLMPSAARQARMSGSLQALSDQLLGMLSTAMMVRMLKERDMLLDLSRDMLDMAEWQGEIPGTGIPPSDRSLSAARQQALLDALKRSLDKLDSLSSVPPQMMKAIMADADRAMSAMSGALSQMSGGNAPGSGSDQAAQRLNALASTLLASADMMEQQCQGSCQSPAGGGLMPGLRRLSGKQAAINALTSQLLEQMLSQGGKEGGAAMGQSAADIARQARQAQQELADELKRLAEQYGREAGGGMEKQTRELEEEARRLAEMLKNPSPEVGDRQERFLVRMLQTTLSMHRQDEGKEQRTSKAAQQIFTNQIISGLPGPAGDVDTYYRLRARALDGNFPEPYRPSIQAYFDSLGVLFLNLDK
jgi:hypothetical protein